MTGRRVHPADLAARCIRPPEQGGIARRYVSRVYHALTGTPHRRQARYTLPPAALTALERRGYRRWEAFLVAWEQASATNPGWDDVELLKAICLQWAAMG